MQIAQIIMVSFILLHSVCANADSSSFFDQRYRGWLWFDEKEKKEEEDIQEKSTTLPTREEMEQAKRENEQFSEELDLLKHLMVRHPDNLDYIKLYKLKEKEMMDKAGALGMNWLMVNFLNPDIVDELKNPQNIYGRDIDTRHRKEQDENILKIVSKSVELYVFRQEGCPHCETLEKHLNNFAMKYGFKVEAIAADKSRSKFFVTHNSPEMIQALGLEVMPTVIAVVSDTRERFELARGAVSIPDLEDRALLLAKHIGLKLLDNANRSNTKQSKIHE